MPLGSAQSLRQSYKSGLNRLVQDYRAYLRRNINETAAPGPGRPRTRTSSVPRQTSTFSITNVTCSGNGLFNDSLVGLTISADKLNDTTSPNATANMSRISQTDGSSKDLRLNVPTGSDETTIGVNNCTGHNREEEAGILGLLVIEPLRNVSHSVRHHPCQSPAIQEALVTRIVNAQDLDRNRNFFGDPEKVFRTLLRQRDDFEL